MSRCLARKLAATMRARLCTKPGRVELARGGIDHGISGRPSTHASQPSSSRRHGKRVPFGTKGLLEQSWTVEQRRVRELAPQQFVLIDAQRVGRQLAQAPVHRGPHRARRQRAELEIRRQAAGAGQVHAVAQLVVVLGVARQPVLEPGTRIAFAAGLDARIVDEAQRLERWQSRRCASCTSAGSGGSARGRRQWRRHASRHARRRARTP